MQEQKTVELLKARNPRGAEELQIHYGPLIRYIIAPILPDPQDREDCFNEVILRVWDKIESYAPFRGSFIGWLTALTRNTALNRARKIHAVSEELNELIPSPAPSPEELLLRQEQKRALYTALGKLSQKDQLLFYRKYYYMQSTAQIASELGMTLRAVEGRLYRIKRHLRKQLGGDEHD